jgi:sugar phosphate isomerase/epimerase
MSNTSNIIACRPGCLDLPLADALHKLKEIGIHHAELNTDADTDFAELQMLAQAEEIGISSLSVVASVVDAPGVEMIEHAITGAAQLGTEIIFLAASVPEGGYDDGIAALRGLGVKADAAGVVLSLETHVPFGHNGEIARRTVEAVDSPGVRWNYDTANVYYYNEAGIDTVAELKKGLPYIASVHLKESARGEPLSFDFPVLGEGIVDFPAVFRMLGDCGFSGPYALELEGDLVNGLPVDEQVAKVKGCMDYLASIGAA